MDEYEKLEKELERHYEVYLARFRNIDFLEHELDLYHQVGWAGDLPSLPHTGVCHRVRAFDSGFRVHLAEHRVWLASRAHAGFSLRCGVA
jgi:hypothetical protein